MDSNLKLGIATLMDNNALEYQWIRSMQQEGMETSTINRSIQRCLGGDLDTADLLRQVALRQASVNKLLNQLDLLNLALP